MASSSVFPSLRRRRSPSLEAFLAPGALSDGGLIQTLVSVARELISSWSGKKMAFQRKNSRCLVRKVEVLGVLLESLKQTGTGGVYSDTSLLCFKELYLLLCRSKILLDYCFQSSKLWLLLQNVGISGVFNDLNQEISTVLDVLPVEELDLSEEVSEQIELLRRQTRRSKLYVHEQDEVLRRSLYSVLNHFENGGPPDYSELRSLLVDRLGVGDARSCRLEIEWLEEQIWNQEEGDLDPPTCVVNGFVALARYCRFLLFGFEEEEMETAGTGASASTGQVEEIGVSVPKDFCCPISLDLMRDPVIISTGQTYDRSSITQWVDEHRTCPKTGQPLAHKHLLPNRALRKLIMQWCAANGITPDPDPDSDSSEASSFSKAAFEANRATAALLIKQLAAEGAEDTKAIAAREIRLMAKTGKEYRAYLAEAGAVPHLRKLLLCGSAAAQENSVTAILNLSIQEKNKSRIMEEEGCLEQIVKVVRQGYTTEARENAAATLFSLSAIHDYKRRIAEEEGAVEALAGLLKHGTIRGKKDAVTALFNLCTHTDNCWRMVDGGAMAALVGALQLQLEGVSEEAAGALSLIARHPVGAQAVGKEEEAVDGLIWMMRCGTPRGKENAVAGLLELCRSSNGDRVLKAAGMHDLLQALLFKGTKRARRKAASLARLFQKHYIYGVGYANRDSGELTLPMSISVPVV